MAQVKHGQILGDDVVVPSAADVTPGWIGRNRATLEAGRRVTRALMVVAPPPVRVALGVASVLADAVLISDEYTRRRGDLRKAPGDIAALGLEGLAVVAASRFAPARLAASLGGIEAAREALRKVRGA